jgi:ABC-type Na+ efflux pump permease subunit
MKRWLGARLVGPVFPYELIRAARGTRWFTLRGAYALFLLVVLMAVYLNWFGSGRRTFEDLLTGRTLPVSDVPKFAQAFFWAFLAVQFVTVLLLTPASVAGAIAQEKERRTLEFLLSTDLHDQEIILGKLWARLVNLMLFLFTGLPVLALVQLLGGVDPNQVLAAFAATAVTMVSLGSLSMLNSAASRTVRGAVFLTYAQSLGYLLLSGFCCTPVALSGGNWNPFWSLSSGNILVAVMRLQAGPGTVKELLEILADYMLFHAVASGLFCFIAWRNLRRWAWTEPVRPVLTPSLVAQMQLPSATVGQVPGQPDRVWLPGKPRPRLGDNAMLWKELHVERGLGFDRFLQTLGPLPPVLFVLTMLYLLLGFCTIAAAPGGTAGDFRAAINVTTRLLGTALLCLMLVGIALRAAGSLTSERERRTLDSLLTTPLEDRAILVAKWLASMWSVRRCLWVLLPAWAMAFLVGALHPLAVLLLVLAATVYLALAANVGLWFSLVSRSTLRATFWTMLAMLVISTAPWLVGQFVEIILALAGLHGEAGRISDLGLHHGLPPATLYLLAFHDGDLTGRRAISWDLISLLAIGLAFYAILAWSLWELILIRFPAVTGRIPSRKGDRKSADGSTDSTPLR